MSGRETFDDALDAAIDQIRDGHPLGAVLAAHPRHADALRPLLETSVRASASARTAAAPMPSGLASNFAIVKAALERERMAAPAVAPRGRPSNTAPWWQRRWTIASMSLPAGVFLFAAFAASGAAAATVVVANPEAAANVVSAVTPNWAESVVPSALRHDDDTGSSGDGAPPGFSDPTAKANEHSDGNGTEGPPEEGSIVHVTVSGVVSELTGNTFLLTAADGAWNVQYDAKTTIVGDILEGANATVAGAQTGEKAIHANEISATGGVTPTPKPGNAADPPSQPEDSGNQADGAEPDETAEPGQTPGTGRNSGNRPESTRTPPAANPNSGDGTPSGLDGDEQGAWGGIGPPGQGTSPSGGGGGQNRSHAGDSGSGENNSNGGGPEEP